MHASMRGFVLLSVVALAVATPYYLPQQRQLFYPIVPQYQQYSNQYSAPLAPLPYRQFVYPQQTAANLVVPMPALRYPSQVVAPTKQVVYYSGALPYPYVLAGDESAEGGGFSSWISTISNYFTGNQGANGETSVESGNTGAAPAPAPVSQEGEKVEQAEAGEQASKGGDKDKLEKPLDMTKLKGVPQQFAVAGHPQYFGNFGLQRFVNPAMVLPTAHNGAVSSYLFLKNIPGVRFASPVPQIPQAADADVSHNDNAQPGEAALDYQKYLQDAQADRMQKDFDDSSVTVDAAEAAQKDAIPEDKPASESEAESDKDNEDEETGPTVAQAKPKAIALAGPGGVAAASPVGTALVGPGGMALSAPEATAVAGVKSASASGVVSPATTKHASKAVRTYQLANSNLAYWLKGM